MGVGVQGNIDKDRVAILLLINSSLIKKAHEIYIQVLTNKSAIQQMPPQSRQGILEQYNNINRRLQCNLGVLFYLESVYSKKTPAQQANRINFPVILTPPPEMPELRSLYKRLQELYPEAVEFLKAKMSQMRMQQESHGMSSNARNTSQGSSTAHFSEGDLPNILQAHNNGSTYLGHQAAPHQEQPQKQQQYKDPQHQNHHQRQNQNPAISSYSLPQTDTPLQYTTPHVANAPPQRQSPSSIASKIPVQHHLPRHHSKRFEISSNGGISPQMMSKETTSASYNDRAGLMNFQGGTNKNETKLSSISPQQILQQQHPRGNSTLGFL